MWQPIVDLAESAELVAESAVVGDEALLSSPTTTDSAAISAVSALVDDLGETEVALSAGEQVEVALAGERRLSLYTVTSALMGEIGWELEYLDPSGVTVAREERVSETYVWAGQTRVFRVRRGDPVMAVAVRFTALSDCVLTQLELIEDDLDNRQDEH
jgi:hypothetical protein